MSKYIYSTVYEQFTGLKPPEPKSHKPRRRRGYGHPYRMRLNMQESEHDASSIEGFEERSGDELDMDKGLQTADTHEVRESIPVAVPQPVLTSHSIRNSAEHSPASRHPKVTYKKRRHFEPGVQPEQADALSF